MRKIIVLSMVSLDGILQAPGSPDEDRSGNFEFGGWVAPYGDETFNKVLKRIMKPSDLLLGRKTFEIWENYWPQHEAGWPGINDVVKYVFSNTKNASDWSNTVFLTELEDIKALKNSPGTAIQVWGSSELIQLLLRHDLVDELWLMTYPLTLGNGKKLFNGGPLPAAFSLVEHVITTKGVIMANYRRAGNVQTGTVED